MTQKCKTVRTNRSPAEISLQLTLGFQKQATSGYTERKFVKCLEDVKVEYDGTVRLANGAIVQFAYGDDGGDGMYTEHYRSKDFPLPRQLEVDPAWTYEEGEAIQAERARLEAAAAHLAELNTVHDGRLTLPLDVLTIEAKVGRLKGERVAAPAVIAAVESAVAKIGTANEILTACLRLRYAAARVCGVDWSVPTLTTVLAMVVDTYGRNQVQPGEMVGVLAAQSISEPATQMTLNTASLSRPSSYPSPSRRRSRRFGPKNCGRCSQ